MYLLLQIAEELVCVGKSVNWLDKLSEGPESKNKIGGGSWGNGTAQSDILFLCVGSVGSLSLEKFNRSYISAFLQQW